MKTRTPTHIGLTAAWLIGLSLAQTALGADECTVKYGYAPSSWQTSTQTVELDSGETKDIGQSNALYVENLNGQTVRVYRTGIGEYVDLTENGRDPAVGNYLISVTLQKVECLASSSEPAPTIQQLVEAAFQSVMNASVSYLGQLNTWANSAQTWAAKTASDWGSCPSNGAQTSYNQLKTWRNNVDASLQEAQQILAEAQAARNSCNATTNNNTLCSTTYNTLPVHGWISSLGATKNSLTVAINAMASLQCPDGCDETAKLTVPTASIQAGRIYSLTNPGWVNAQVCTKLSFGSIGFNTSAIASGNLTQAVEAEPPACAATTNLRICTNWDMEGLLAALQRLRLVPPGVEKIELDIPTRSVTVVTGVERASCQNPLRVCAPSGNVTISVNEGEDLFSSSGSCSDYLTVGCQSPPFGLQPTTRQIDVPYLPRATVRWGGLRPGSITIDLTRREFSALCLGRGRTDLRIPGPPTITMSTTTVDLPFLCTQPSWTQVVANP